MDATRRAKQAGLERHAKEIIVDKSAAGAGASSLAVIEATREHGPIGHLPVWENITAAHVEAGVRALLEDSEAAFTALEGAVEPSWAGLMEPLERLQTRIGQVIGAVTHLISVKYSDELQAAYDAIRPAYISLLNRMSQSRGVYEGLIGLRDGPDWSALGQARQRIVTESIRAMERSGVHLEGPPKERFKEIQERLSELSNDFSVNLVKEEKASRICVDAPEDVAGVPAAVLGLAAAQAREDGVDDATDASGPWHFVVNGVNFVAVMEHAADRGLRERFYRAFRARGTSE